VSADFGDNSVFSNRGITTWLMALNTEITFTTIESCTFDRIESNRFCCFKRPVITGVGGVDLMAGAAVLTGYAGYAFKLCWVLSSSNSRAERCT